MERLSLSLPQAMVLYVAGGAVCGAMYGGLLPVARRSEVARAVVGALVGATAFGGVALIVVRDSETPFAVLALSAVLGAITGASVTLKRSDS